jgi:hypothetical protein
VHRTVAEEPGVGFQQFLVPLQDRAQVGRARFLLALEEDLQVDRRCYLERREGVQGRDEGDDGSLVSPAERP